MTEERGSLRKILTAETEMLSLHVAVQVSRSLKINPNPRQIGAEHGKLGLISGLSAWPGTNLSRRLRSHRIIMNACDKARKQLFIVACNPFRWFWHSKAAAQTRTV